MLHFSFRLTNPFSNRHSLVYVKSGKTWNHNKFWEFGVYKTNAILGVNFDFNLKQDHVGACLELELFGWSVECQTYDNRHWDQKNNCWETY